MAVTKAELTEWMATLPADALIGIDEDGMLLVATAVGQEGDAFLMGGVIEADEEEEG